MKTRIRISTLLALLLTAGNMQCRRPEPSPRSVIDFTGDWKFYMDPYENSVETLPEDTAWRDVDLPHDWSIEGEFSPDHPSTPGGGALPGGVGWYCKKFYLEEAQSDKNAFIEFDGIYRNSEVWINGHFLGFRPNGYISFRYDLTPHLHFGKSVNEILVRVDNSVQPNSRWYSGSGIYRNVRLVITSRVYVDPRGIFITTPEIRQDTALLEIKTRIRNSSGQARTVSLHTHVRDGSGRDLALASSEILLPGDSLAEIHQKIGLSGPRLWSTSDPFLYAARSEILADGIPTDEVTTPFGIRHFRFDPEKGFSLNGEPMKIKGVCMHHDLGCLGSAVNARAMERQLEILKAMGCNSIRTSHNPPDPGFLDLCDRMGILVMDEAFDMWKRGKSTFDYHMYWDEWGRQDLEDQVLRDRNHPCVIAWSIGNEVLEQWDSTGTGMAAELAALVRGLDPTRPVTSGLNDPVPHNYIVRSGALDLIGFNYHSGDWMDFPEKFPGQKFIATETTSALATRGSYDLPSDSLRIWPPAWDLPFCDGNPDHTCSSYDNCHVPWGSTHEEVLRLMERYDFISGIYVWTGFDYLGEPTPYSWPSRSSCFGIVDLAGFPKDAYYLYQSRWTGQPVLHLFPHWNWQQGDTVDVIAYTSCTGAELFLNGVSMGTGTMEKDRLHLHWKVPFQPGELKATGRMEGGRILEATVRTAGTPAKIRLEADRGALSAGKKDLAFITVTVTDKKDIPVPNAENLIRFNVEGPGSIAGVDNGNPASQEHFRAEFRKCFNGKCLLVLRSGESPGSIRVRAASPGLEPAGIRIRVKPGIS